MMEVPSVKVIPPPDSHATNVLASSVLLRNFNASLFSSKNANEYLNNSHFAQVLEICNTILTNKSIKIHKDISFINFISS